MIVGPTTPAAADPAALAPAPGGAAAPGGATTGTPGLFSALLATELEKTVERSGADPAAAADSTSASSSATAPAPVSKPVTGGHGYVVRYADGATPVNVGPSPAPFVKGPTGRLEITARTTGLTQLTGRFSGTVSDPTAAAKATPSVMAAIAALQADGQA